MATTECEYCGDKIATLIGKSEASDRYHRVETRSKSGENDIPSSIVRYFCSEQCVGSFYGGNDDD